MALLPAISTGYRDGSAVAASTSPAVGTEVRVSDGIWTFQGYDHQSQTVNGSDVNFTGTWTFEATPTPPAWTYTARYSFVSASVGQNLPAEVVALLPSETTGHRNGDVVDARTPAVGIVVSVPGGHWTFQGYEQPSQTIDQADIHFTGSWIFTATPTYTVRHQFVSASPGRDLPREVLALVPTEIPGHQTGSQVTPTSPSRVIVDVSGGRWTFQGYDQTSQTIDGSDVTFVAKWVFVAKTSPSTSTSSAPSPSRSTSSSTSMSSTEPLDSSSSSKTSKVSAKVLPKTGTVRSAGMVATGLGIMVLGLGLFINRRRKETTETVDRD